MARRFNTLPALPGSSDDGVQVIAKVLDFLEKTESPSRQLLLSWITQEYGVKGKTAVNAIQGIDRSGLIVVRRDGKVHIKDLGRQVQKMGFVACNRLLAPRFLAI